jgi:hypothetical protein
MGGRVEAVGVDEAGELRQGDGVEAAAVFAVLGQAKAGEETTYRDGFEVSGDLLPSAVTGLVLHAVQDHGGGEEVGSEIEFGDAGGMEQRLVALIPRPLPRRGEGVPLRRVGG